jgi:FMN phosphatase YigB (HAD superfamily)
MVTRRIDASGARVYGVRRRAAHERPVVFLLDVDNTLLDNDRLTADLERHLKREVGPECAVEYFEILEQLRAELGYADYLGALQQYRAKHTRDHRLLAVSSFLLDYPFADCVFPGAREVLEHLGALGLTVILSDGDVVFQPRKIARSGLGSAVEGRILIYIHKERELVDVEQRFPAEHYVLVDDKVRILSAIKTVWGDRLTTIFPRQGHYAHDPQVAAFSRPDITIERIAELRDYDLPALLAAARGNRAL